MVPFRAILIAFKVSPRSAIAALWARVCGRRVRARNIIYAAAHRGPGYYPLWTTLIEPQKVEAYCRGAPTVANPPPIIAVIFGGREASQKAVRETVSSLRTAFDRAVTICCDIAGSAQLGCLELLGDQLRDLLDVAEVAHSTSWLMPLFAGDTLTRRAGDALAVALESSPDAEIVYWDEDRVVGGKRRDPWLKPSWDELLFLARDFVTGTSILKSSAILDDSCPADLPLTPQGFSAAVISLVSRSKGRPRTSHIPLILSHRTPRSNFATALERKDLTQAMWHQPVELEEIPEIPGTLRPRFLSTVALPKVSILIPTRNRLELLRKCLDGLFALDYAGPIEIIVIDNDSDDAATAEYLEQLRGNGVTVLRHPGPFNFSAMNNRAAKLASGELLCLLNNDIEMENSSWLEAMVRHAIRPGTGAVGALLKYPDGTVQHAGVSVGTGDAAGHVYRGIAVGDAGHRNMHRLTHEVTAVTAACMVIRKETFLEVGGFDETDLKVAFNDVDLCLKLSQRGYRNIFAGEACLTHHESKSRGSDFSEANHARYLRELAHLQAKWKTKGFVDPYSHPLAMRSSEKFVLGP